MKELVGFCAVCNREIYCQDGFLDGVILDDQSLQCFSCDSKNTEDQQK